MNKPINQYTNKTNKPIQSRKQFGMSVIEVVLAAAIFVIFASSAVRSLLQNYNANRTGAEYTVASQFASEGLEAVRSIKNQSFANLNAVDSSARGLVSGNVTSGLIGYWKMDENTGTTASDSSGNGKNGTFGPGAEAPTWNTGKYSSAVSFDGGDRVTIDSTFTIPTTNFTYASWFYLNSSADASIFSAEDDTGTDADELLISVSGSNLSVKLNNSLAVFASVTLNTGTWYHLAAVRSGSSVTAYLDGASVGSGTNGAVLNFSDCPLHLGRDPINGCPTTAYGWALNGRMDEVRVYNRALSPAEIGQIFSSSAGWSLGANGTNNSLTHSNSDNYVRTVKVESVNRDGVPPAGNIVASGGTADPDTKKITSTVNWNFSAGRPETLSLITYLSDWIKPISSAIDAILVYTDATTTTTDNTPKYRTYTDSTNTFGTETDTTATINEGTAVPRTYKIKTSPTKTEAIAGYVTSTGNLRIMCFDGTTWTSEFTVAVGNTANNQRFDIAFEQTTGDAMVVYSGNVATTNELRYRTKLGSTGCGSANWSAATNLDPVRTSAIVAWIKLEASPVASSNRIYLAWNDVNNDLSAMGWDGTGWTIAEPAAALETNLERVSTTAGVHDSYSFDIAVEASTGNAMIVWGLSQATTCTAGTTIATTNCIRYARYTTSWSAVAAIPTVADPATNIDISANPNTSELIVASTDNSQADMSLAYWSGSAWTGQANADTDTTAVAAGNKIVATGWLISGGTTRAVVAYSNADSAGTPVPRINTNIRIIQTPMTTTPAAGTEPTTANSTLFDSAPDYATTQRWFEIAMDPNDKDRLMVLIADNNVDLFAKRLVMTSTPTFTWSNADGGTAALENALGIATNSPYGFAYWRNP